MPENLNEKISVLVSFMKNRVLPLSFEWSGRKYQIEKVNMAYASRDGGKLWHYFSVVSGNGFFKLAFDTENCSWQVQEADFNC